MVTIYEKAFVSIKDLDFRLPASKNLIIFCWIFLANKRRKFKWGEYRRSFCRSNTTFSMKPCAYQSDQLHAVTIVSHLKPMFDVNRSTFAKIFTSSSYIQFCQKYHVLPCHLFYLDIYACSLGTEVKLKRVSKRFCGTNAAFSLKPRAQELDQLLTVTFVSHFKPTFDANSSTFAKIFNCSSYALFCQKHHVLLCCHFCLKVYVFCIHLVYVSHMSWPSLLDCSKLPSQPLCLLLANSPSSHCPLSKDSECPWQWGISACCNHSHQNNNLS